MRLPHHKQVARPRLGVLICVCVSAGIFVQARARADDFLPGGCDMLPRELAEHCACGVSDFRHGRYRDAEASFALGQRLRSGGQSLRNVAAVKSAQGEYDTALESLQRAMAAERDPLTTAQRAEVPILLKRLQTYSRVDTRLEELSRDGLARDIMNELEQALAAGATALIWMRIAFVASEIGDYQRATWAAENALVYRDAPLDELERKQVEALLRKLRDHVATVKVKIERDEWPLSGADHALISVDGQPWTSQSCARGCEIELRLAPGKHTVHALLGKESGQRDVVANENRVESTQFFFGRPMLMWASLGYGAVGLLWGTVAGLRSMALQRSSERSCGELDSECEAPRVELMEQATKRRTESAIAFAVAGVGLVTSLGAWLYVMRRQKLQLSPESLGSNGHGLVLRGRF